MFGFKDKEKKHSGNKDKTPAEMTESIVDDNTKEAQQESQIPPITWREIKYLKKARYNEIKDKFKINCIKQGKSMQEVLLNFIKETAKQK